MRARTSLIEALLAEGRGCGSGRPGPGWQFPGRALSDLPVTLTGSTLTVAFPALALRVLGLRVLALRLLALPVRTRAVRGWRGRLLGIRALGPLTRGDRPAEPSLSAAPALSMPSGRVLALGAGILAGRFLAVLALRGRDLLA